MLTVIIQLQNALLIASSIAPNDMRKGYLNRLEPGVSKIVQFQPINADAYYLTLPGTHPILLVFGKAD
jgi:hypothetical protein